MICHVVHVVKQRQQFSNKYCENDIFLQRFKVFSLLIAFVDLKDHVEQQTSRALTGIAKPSSLLSNLL